jgi:biopolymer transport protein ExbB
LPSIEELELFWFEMQREMTENGLVKRFQAPIILPDGKEVTKEVVRVGPFTAMSEGRYLAYLPESRKFTELSRQPGSGMMGMAGKLQTETSGYHAAVLDPTRGSLLAVLVQAPSLAESMQYGGLVGYVIMTLAVIGLGLAALRLMRLAVIGRAVAKQRLNIDSPLDTNPLGRVLRSYHDHPDVDNETLQLHLDEAILKEVPKLQAGLSPLKILAAIGPLLGLLGTVTGMIITFQQITLFGTGDPKLMASGISQALVTTVQGLVMSIPLLLLHSFLQSRSKDLIQLLEEETAGIIAMQAEKARLKSLQKQNL